MGDLNVYAICMGGLAAALVLGFQGAPLWAWTAFAAAGLALAQVPVPILAGFAVLALIFNVPPIRRVLLTSWLLKFMKGVMPQISDTERDALKAGDVWVEGELFSGKPSFDRLLSEKYPDLTAEEQAFIDGPVEELCKLVKDWDVHQKKDLPPEAWDYIKKKGFFGMGIPKEYGGLAFTAMAHSEVLLKLSSRSVPLGITVMVPNSLGPAELLVHYGTDEQKKHYLPRLARGEDVPCFALTEPTAGSDAASIQASGVVFRGDDGQLYLKLNWNKRWITLAAISTVLGLAFRLKDPDNLLGKGTDPGITCALIPTKTAGVTANRRHDPLGIPFFNCPTQGKDVVVPIDAIIGGPARAGQGWRMLMESLAAGRGISLPAQATTGAKCVARVASAHATVRKQFGMSIGKFEGIVEPLARIAGSAYMFEAARRYTLGGIDRGVKPPVVTAMAKYYFTEMQRQVVNDGMDILGGAAISRGPRNLLANGYASLPVSITVEGANILTRTLIIFGQGALRAHPYAYKEVEAVAAGDLAAFDQAFWSHVGHVVRNTFRSILLSLTRGWLSVPYRGGVTAKYYRRLAWSSASFAFLADVAMGTMGAKLKTRGKTTGRFADILAWMYIATATLRRFEAEGRRREDEPFLRWSLDHCFGKIQEAFDALLGNFDAPLVGLVLRGPVRWLGSLNPIGHRPSDRLDARLAELIQIPGAQRDRITHGIFLPKTEDEAMARLENAFLLTVESEEVFGKVRRAIKQKLLKKAPPAILYKEAVGAGVITQEEFEKIARAEAARNDAIQVDDFGLKEYLTGTSAGTSPVAAVSQPQAQAR